MHGGPGRQAPLLRPPGRDGEETPGPPQDHSVRQQESTECPVGSLQDKKGVAEPVPVGTSQPSRGKGMRDLRREGELCLSTGKEQHNETHRQRWN